MPRRKERSGLDMVDDLVDSAVETLFERGTEFFERMREQRMEQVRSLPAGQQRDSYTCAACRKQFPLDAMEMVNPSPQFGEYGMCRGCFSFVWQAGKEKTQFLAKKAREAAEARARAAASAAPPQRKPPWEVLGVSSDASVDEINKAWRKLAAQYHPDRFSGDPNVTDADRTNARAMFDELTRCRDAMLRVRQPPKA